MPSKTYLSLPVAPNEYNQVQESVFRSTVQNNLQGVSDDIVDLGNHTQKDASLSLRKFQFLSHRDNTPSEGKFFALTVGGTTSVTSILDENDFSSDSATALATQQSIKAYIDSGTAGADLDFAGGSGTGSVALASQTFTIAGTSNEIVTAASGQTLTISLPDDVTIGDDLTLGSDAAVLGFGADTDVTLTHVHDTGLLLNSTRQLQFFDSSQRIAASSATVMTIGATDEIDLQATLIDLNGNVDVSGNLELDSDGAVLGFGVNNDVTLTHVHNTGLLLNSTRQLQFFDSSQRIAAVSATVLSIGATDEIDLQATAIDLNGTVDISGAATLATSLNIAGDGATVTGIKDEDTMSSNSATKLATQQSIKAYVDSQVDTITASTGLKRVSDDIRVNYDDSGNIVDAPTAISGEVAADDLIIVGDESLTNNAVRKVVIGDINVGIFDNDQGYGRLGSNETVTGTWSFSTTVTANNALALQNEGSDFGGVSGYQSIWAYNNGSTTELRTRLSSSTVMNIPIITGSAANDELLVSTGTDHESDWSGSGLTWNGTTLTATNFSGNGANITNISATAIGVTDLTSQDATYYPVMSDGTSGDVSMFVDASEFSYTSDTNTLNAVNIDVDGTLETDAFSINGTTVSSTAAELNILDGATVVVGEINYLDLGTTGVGTAIASKAVILNANKDYTGIRNFTITGELDAATLDISGDADIDGTLETDALSINGTAVSSTAAELNILDGATVVVGEINYLDLGSTAVGTAIASKAVVLDSNKDYTGIRNFTITGELDAGSLDISGDADIDGTTNLDVVDIDGAVDMASTLTLAGNADFNGDLDVDGTTNLDVVDIDGAVDMASTLTIASTTTIAGRLGIGTTSPSSYYTTNLVIANTSSGASSGMTLANADNGQGRIDFADGTSGAAQYRGTISYSHDSTPADGYMRFVAGGNEALRLGSNYILMAGLPTSDPGVNNSLWNDSGTLKIS